MSELSVIIPDLHGDFFGGQKIIEAACLQAKNRLNQEVKNIIQVGDFGVGAQSKFMKNLDQDCYFIYGNHERFDRFNKYQESVIQGCWNFKPCGSVLGEVLFVGGANSPDKEYRLKNGFYWDKRECIDQKEKDRVRQAIKDHDIKVVISHDCPASFDMNYACMPQFGGEDKNDDVRVFLQEVLEEARPSQWFFGHWHKSGTGQELGCKWRCIGLPFDYEFIYLDL